MKVLTKSFVSVFLIIGIIITGICFTNFSKSNGDVLAKADASDVSVWTLNSAEKTKQIMQANTASTSLNIKMAKGESEGAQVMITPKKNILVKNVKVSRLENGYSYIPNENVEIYYASYVELTNNYNSSMEDFQVGDKVSDAIFPFKTCLEYGMNTVVAGNTQAIYIEVTTPANIVAGTYRATVKVETSAGVYNVPFTVTVWNYDISHLTLKTEMCMTDNRGRFSVGELDSSDEMATYYFEAGLKYGMCSSLPFDGTGGTERYVSLLRKYYNHPHFTAYRLYYELVQGGFNVDLLAEYLVAIGKASVEDGANYFDKAYTYFSNIVDEPYTQEQFDNLSRTVNQLNESIEYAVQGLKEYYAGTFDYAYVQSVLEPSMRSIENITTISTETSIGKVEETVETTMCPQLNFYNTQSQRDVIDSCFSKHKYQTSKWTYTCLYPKYPYPNNHLDDYNLNYRVMGWMLDKYDIDGYLMWCSVLNVCGEGRNPYKEDVRVGEYSMDVSTACPGDGFMFYPGRPYGINGPVASLRAVAFRDGVEDYESLKVLKSIYAEKGIDSQSVLNSLYNRIFSGTISTADQTTFDDVRATLGEMINESNGSLGIIYKQIDVVANRATIDFMLTDSEAKVEYNGNQLVAVDGVYRVVIDLSTQSFVRLKVINGSQSVIYNKFVAGKFVLVSDLDTSDDLHYFSTNKDSTLEINTDGKYINGGLNASTHLALTGKVGSSSFHPFFALDFSAYDVGAITNTGFYVYCDYSAGLTLSVCTFTGTTYALMDNINLQYGWNYITIDLNSANLSYDKKLYCRADNLVNADGAYSVDLYFNSLMILMKGE